MQFLIYIAQFLLVVGISFVVLTLITSFTRFQYITRKAQEADGSIDPHDAFQVQIAHRLGTAHLEPEPFLVMALAPRRLPTEDGASGEPFGEAFLDAIEKRVQAMLRSTDTVVHVGGGRIGVIVDASREKAECIVRRILDGIQKNAVAGIPGQPTGFSLCAGISTHPENGDRVKTLVESAKASLQAAGLGEFFLAAIEGEPTSATASSDQKEAESVVEEPAEILQRDPLGIALQKYVAQFRKQDAPVSILLLEVDHFERYSEHYGPSAKDEILRRLSAFLQGAVRESDLIGQMDENTFLVATGCAPRDAITVAHRLVGAVKKTIFPIGGSNLRITFSVGVAGYPDHGGHPRRLVEYADAALQTAKENGRSMCLMYEPSMRAVKNKASTAETF